MNDFKVYYGRTKKLFPLQMLSFDTHESICNFWPVIQCWRSFLSIKIYRQGTNEIYLYGHQKECLNIRQAFSSIINSCKAFLMQVIDTPSQHQIQVALLNRELWLRCLIYKLPTVSTKYIPQLFLFGKVLLGFVRFGKVGKVCYGLVRFGKAFLSLARLGKVW
jgi:hypothetical protein